MRLGGLTPSLAEVLDPDEPSIAWRSFLNGRTGWARPWSLFVLNEWVRWSFGPEAGIAGTRSLSCRSWPLALSF